MIKHKLNAHLVNQIEREANFFWLNVRFNIVSSIIAKYKLNNLLDVGAGSGKLGRDIKEKNSKFEYYFDEPDIDANKQLIKDFGQKYKATKNNRKFESIALLDVLEHVENPINLLEDCFSKLQKGGVMIISVPAYQFLWSNWDVLLGHYKRYTVRSMSELLDNFNIEILEKNYLFPELLFPAFLRKISKTKSEKFPKIPDFINRIFYFFSLIISKFRRVVPFGLSVFFVVKKIDD
jgi:SAM-dependent methyltransferase